eukprot:SAG11_NODE_9843_length_876_cov_1.867439_1_plen_70_part_10
MGVGDSADGIVDGIAGIAGGRAVESLAHDSQQCLQYRAPDSRSCFSSVVDPLAPQLLHVLARAAAPALAL